MAEGLPGTSRVNVKGLRERLGLNQAELADRLHVDERTIRRWEHGTSRPSPMAMAHMRALVKPKPDAAPTTSVPASEAEHEMSSALHSSAPPTLPRRRLPTF